MALEESSKAIIDSLSHEELEYEFHLGRHSRFQNENFTYVKARLAKVQREEQESSKERGHLLTETANDIATESLITTKLSYRIAVLAIVVMLLAIILPQWFK